MQGLSSYGSLTGPSANAAAAVATTVPVTTFHDQQRQTHHHSHHSHHPDNINHTNNRAAFLAGPASTTAAAHAFATSRTTDLSATPMANVPIPLPLTSIDITPMFSAGTPSSPKSFASSTSFSVPLNIPTTSKQSSGLATVTPAESSPNGSRKELSAAPSSTSTELPAGAPGKRGYKSHVPSACINCKKAHLACDVSRPCKRCVALGKADTCQDIRHKKRGRPRLRDKQSGDQPRDSCYEVMYGTIQTPTFAMAPPIAPHPPTVNRHMPLIATPTPSASSSSTIAFVHETTSSFQDHTPLPVTPIPVFHQAHPTPNSTLDTPSNPNSNFLNTLAFSFEEVSFPDNTNAIQQHYVVQPYPSAFPVNTHQQQQEVREHVQELMRLNNAYGKQQRPVPTGFTPSPMPQQPSSLPLRPNRGQHPVSFPQKPMHMHHRPTPQSQSPPTPSPSLPRRRRQQSIPSPVELHHGHVQRGYRNQGEESRHDNHMATIVMSMEVCCARVSSEVTELWGYYPQEFAHRSFYDFISPKDTDRLARLHRLLLDNMVEMAQATDPHYSPPDTERTTSDLFHNRSMEELMMVAPGSSSFSDTLHVKKRSGDTELYEMVVCMGGAFGADLSHPASLSKVYIIGQLKKHEYRVSSSKYSLIDQPTTTPNNNHEFRLRFQSPDVVGLSSSPLPSSTTAIAEAPTPSNITTLHHPHYQQRSSPPSSGMILAYTPITAPSTSHPDYRQSTIGGNGGGQVFRMASAASMTTSFSMPVRDTGRTIGYQELRSTSGLTPSSTALPSRFKSSSHNNGSNMEPAKVNVAPITMQTKYNANVATFPQKLRSNALPSMFRHNSGPSTTPGAVYANGPSAATAPPIGESSNPYSTLASYRLGNNSSGPTSVTHPTTQYFLQTSSSTLNAAASAAQSITRQKGLYMSTADMADNDKAAGSTDSNRKVEMSIRSLLC